jgi:UDP-N-acetylglucosamine--N-acetylmuramyl-(pentapeptide) pyrophosphoryl-undecaprenol N-acetylglucosamine transferase
MKMHNVVLTGGGTGGHIFPAIAIANALRSQNPDMNIQFVGALGKMEMQRVPEAGYPITGLPVSGLIRKITLKNIRVILNAWRSFREAKKLLQTQQADLVIGTGGFASLPVCYAASRMGIPLFIWEGNSFAGLTNKLLNKSATRIYCGFDGMNTQFPNGNWIHTGNPIRLELLEPVSTADALAYFKFSEKRPTLFITGGSLGALSINEATETFINQWLNLGYAIIWQTGKSYISTLKHPNLWSGSFLKEMKFAYHLADVVVSRSGALSVSEIMASGVPAIFVPSPNVTDDHQTKNAQKATSTGGGILVTDELVCVDLGDAVIDLMQNETRREQMRQNLLLAAKPDATNVITKDILSHL